jgi:hypothetical protein
VITVLGILGLAVFFIALDYVIVRSLGADPDLVGAGVTLIFTGIVIAILL